MPAYSRLDVLHPQDHGPQIVFDALPIDIAKSFLVVAICFALALGAVLLETANHIRFDIALIAKEGWKQPAKLVSRMAYLLCRLLSPVILILILCFIVFPMDNCTAMPETFNVLGMILLDSVSLIFVQRTMALYSWRSKVVIPLTILYFLVVAVAAICIPFYGVGIRIPESRFCAFNTRRNLPRVLAVNIAYKTCAMGLDFTLLVLTLHRLVEGGLKGLWVRKPKQFYTGLKDTSLSSFLIRQGFHFYIIQTCTEIIFIILYFSSSMMAYQVLGSCLLYSIPPIVAGSAFRDMGKKASRVQTRHGTKINEIINSDNTHSAHRSLGRPTAATRNSLSMPVATIGRDSDPPATDSPAEKPSMGTRVNWGVSPTLSSRLPPTADSHLTDGGVLVTIGTVSHTDEVDGWVAAGSPRYSSDANDPDLDEIQRTWPRLAAKSAESHAKTPSSMEDTAATTSTLASSSTAHHADRGHDSSKDYDEHEMQPRSQKFEEIQVPTLARTRSSTPPDHLQHIASEFGVEGSTQTSNSPWIPRTPESPYRAVLSTSGISKTP